MAIRVLYDSREDVAAFYSSVTEQLFGRLIHPASNSCAEADDVALLILKLDKADFLRGDHGNVLDVAFINAACEEIEQLDPDVAWDLIGGVIEWSDEAALRVLEKVKAEYGLPLPSAIG